MITNTHYSDIMRLQLLSEHGGTWIDSTVLCTDRRFAHVMELPLFVFCSNKKKVSFSPWFIVSSSGNPVIMLTKELIFRYWQDYNYLMHYFLINMFFRMSANTFKEAWAEVPLIHNRPLVAMYYARHEEYSAERVDSFLKNSGFHKLTYKIEPDNPPSQSSIYQHILDTF